MYKELFFQCLKISTPLPMGTYLLYFITYLQMNFYKIMSLKCADFLSFNIQPFYSFMWEGGDKIFFNFLYIFFFFFFYKIVNLNCKFQAKKKFFNIQTFQLPFEKEKGKHILENLAHFYR